MNQRSFNIIYNQLIDESKRASAIYLIAEDLPISLEFFKQKIDVERDKTLKMELIAIYNDLIHKQYPLILHYLLTRQYISHENILSHFTSFIFNYHSYETQSLLDKLIHKLIGRMDKSILENGSSKEIISELNDKITKNFLIDNSFLSNYDIVEVHQNPIISQYTLSILFLIIAEKLNLPLFGIPFHDKLVLCYTYNYCTHNELVSEEDIIYYIVVGEKDLIYTPLDLKLYSYLLSQEIDLENKLPKSSQYIIKKWIEHIVNCPFDHRTRKNLSSKYQQIFSNVRDFELF